MFCEEAKAMPFFCLSSTEDSVDRLALNLSYLLLSILSLSLFSLGRGKNALSSKIHFTFRQIALFVILCGWSKSALRLKRTALVNQRH